MADRYAGIDWASDKHDVLVADETGTEVLAGTYAHDEKGLSALCRALVRLEVVLVAVERPEVFGYELDRVKGAMAALVSSVDGSWAFAAAGTTWRTRSITPTVRSSR